MGWMRGEDAKGQGDCGDTHETLPSCVVTAASKYSASDGLLEDLTVTIYNIVPSELMAKLKVIVRCGSLNIISITLRIHRVVPFKYLASTT